MDKQNKTVVTVIHNLTAKPEARDACVVVIYGPDLGKKYNLDTPSLIIGRSSKCDIQIDQESVSRNHAKIVNNGQSVMIRDLGSTNGTVVNDKPQTELILRDGDLITIGRTILKFITGDNIENAYHEEIYRLTTVDGLTQAFNKRYFLETLEREISRAARYQRALSLIMFDLDHFKRVNDTYGHLAGDYVLKHLAQVIANRIRREDVLARYGGEEFSIILPEIERDNAIIFADKVRRLVERTSFVFENRTLPITISIGVAPWTPDITTPADLIRRADEHLYEAKNAGRNCVRG